MVDQRFAINLALALFAALLAAGLGLVHFAWVEPQRMFARSTAWTRVPATVVESEADDEGDVRHVFEYRVGGTTYRSSRASFWPGPVRFQHPVGARVMPLVNPARPSEAVLRPEHRPPSSTLWSVAAWPFVAGSGFLMFLAVRLNLMRIRVNLSDGRKLYYREMGRPVRRPIDDGKVGLELKKPTADLGDEL